MVDDDKAIDFKIGSQLRVGFEYILGNLINALDMSRDMCVYKNDCKTLEDRVSMALDLKPHVFSIVSAASRNREYRNTAEMMIIMVLAYYMEGADTLEDFDRMVAELREAAPGMIHVHRLAMR